MGEPWRRGLYPAVPEGSLVVQEEVRVLIDLLFDLPPGILVETRQIPFKITREFKTVFISVSSSLLFHNYTWKAAPGPSKKKQPAVQVALNG